MLRPITMDGVENMMIFISSIKAIHHFHNNHNAFCFGGVGFVMQMDGLIVIQIQIISMTIIAPQNQKVLWECESGEHRN